MNTHRLPPNTSLSLLRSLGMLLQQAGMYGLLHNVASLALREAFAHFESTLAVYGTIEFTKTEHAFLVNGHPVDTKDAMVRLVVEKFSTHNLGGLVFKPELDNEEFALFAKIISSSAATLNQLGGLKRAIEGAELKTIATSETAYRQISSSLDIPPPVAKQKTSGRHTTVIDLSDALSETDVASQFDTISRSPSHATQIEKARKKRNLNVEQIVSMLRATAALIENEGLLPGELGQRQILASIERILKMVETSSRETRAQIAKLAGQVNADRQTIANIESAARKEGIGFNLTREELLEHYSEINQEMLQPITASTGAIELLLSGKGDELTPSQKKLLKLAFEGLQRTSQLVEFTNRISGLPESYIPDQKVIDSSYS